MDHPVGAHGERCADRDGRNGVNRRRLSSAERDKQLRSAIARIERGRASTSEATLTFASVAREAGVSTSLIHNHHKGIADLIRFKQGRQSRAGMDAKGKALSRERKRIHELRQEITALKREIARLASINELQAMAIEDLQGRRR